MPTLNQTNLTAPNKMTCDELEFSPALLKRYGRVGGSSKNSVAVAFVMFNGAVEVYGLCNDHEKNIYRRVKVEAQASLLKASMEAGRNVSAVYRDLIM